MLFRVGGVPEHFNLPWKQALADNAFAIAGLDVRYTDYPEGTGKLTRDLRDDELDVALVLTEGAVADIIEHGSNQLVKVYVSSPLTWGIHVAANSDIRHIGDIRDRRIAISRYGSGSHLIAIVDAAERGWPTDSMAFEIVNNLDGARAALAAGAADVFLWEKHMTQPLVDNGEFRRVGQREVPWPAFVVSVRRSLLPAAAPALRCMLDIVARYGRNLSRNQSAPALIAETYGLRLRDAESWLATVRWSGSYRRPNAALERTIRALEAQGVIAAGTGDLDALWQPI